MGEISEALRRARAQSEGEGLRSRAEARPPASPWPAALGPPRAELHAISREKDRDWVGRAVLVEPRGPVAERFRHLAIRVREELEHRRPPVLLVTSAGRGEGKTTTACNLALALASIAAGQRLALVDLDLRRPSLESVFGIGGSEGDEPTGGTSAPVGSVCVRTDLPALDLYPVTQTPHAAHEFLAGPALGVLLQELTRRYDLVVCDTPPVLPVPDVALLTQHAGACLAVVRSGSTRRSAFREMMHTLPVDKLIGTFLNQAGTLRGDYRYYTYQQDDDT